MRTWKLIAASLPFLWFAGTIGSAAEPATATSSASAPLRLVVMDPLAEPLSCPCVEGYAQRKYEKLAEYLSQELGREVTVAFGESLKGALEKGKIKSADVIIGKDSVVRAQGAERKMKLQALARLTDKEGSTTQTGWIVVRSSDPAQSVKDLAGYRILYGPAECDEKFAAPRALLKSAGIDVVAAEQAEISAACSDGACKIIEWGDSEQAAAVISSYAAPLLEGCGTIQKGELRVVAKTSPVPFITAFANEQLPKEDRAAIQKLLLGLIDEPELLLSLETLTGFEPIKETPKPTADKAAPVGDKTTGTAPPGSPPAGATAGWTGWRGPHRDARCRSLPTRLPEQLTPVWQIPLAHAGLGGIAATSEYVILGDRDLQDQADEFRCYDAATGDLVWVVTYPATGRLDYGNSPRATPLVHEEKVYLFGAFGDLTCVDLVSGIELWRMNVRERFAVEDPLIWGTCSSPLVVDEMLIVNPGAAEASLVALDLETGDVIWQAPGEPAGYGSLIVATLGGRRQIVGHDRTSLGGWDPASGERLWKLVPPRDGDFNVPTPVVVKDQLLVVTEGNGARLYAFDDEGKILPQPTAVNKQMACDMSSPVVVGNRVFCVCGALVCLDAAAELAEVWVGEDDAWGDYAPLVADHRHLLAFGCGGELLLIDATADSMQVVSRVHPLEDPTTRHTDLYPHPALVGTRLYLRGEHTLACFELGDEGLVTSDVRSR